MAHASAVTPLSVVLGDYPHTRPLRSGASELGGVACRFPEVAPLHSAFARMVRRLEFDVCELALATYLQAREAGVPVTLLPLVMVGDVHHGSLNRRPGSGPASPSELIGGKVAVRAYSQTTGLWVRGILREEHGIDASRLTWVTTEECHVEQYREPPWVTRTGTSVLELLRRDEVDAAVVGPGVLAKEGIELVPVIPDAERAGQAWLARHDVVPVNHMVVVRSELVNDDRAAVRAVYHALKASIEATEPERDGSVRERAVTAGWSEPLGRTIELASRYAVEQKLLREPVDVTEIVEETAFLDALA